jgi:hypothetical protein
MHGKASKYDDVLCHAVMARGEVEITRSDENTKALGPNGGHALRTTHKISETIKPTYAEAINVRPSR